MFAPLFFISQSKHFFMAHKKEQRNFTDRNLIMTGIIAVLVFLSIGLTILEMQDPHLSTETINVFYAIHMSILVIFFLELVYRFIISTSIYPELSPAKARLVMLSHPLTIIDIIVIIPLFLAI